MAIVGAAGEMDTETTMAVVTTAGADDAWAHKILIIGIVARACGRDVLFRSRA